MSIPLNDSLSSPRFFADSYMSYEIDKADYTCDPNTEFSLTYPEERDFKMKPDNLVKYKINNYGHRSDDFKTLDKNKTNILFAGCSITFGVALPEQYRWSKMLYNELDIDSKGEYHCLGFLGGGSDKIVSNIMKYCNQFGNPDIIFVLYSDFTRQTKYIEQSGHFMSKIEADYSTRPIGIKNAELAYDLFTQTQAYIRILEIFCKSHNITLITSCWDSKTADDLEKLDLKNLYKMGYIDPSYIDFSSIPKEYEKFLIKARDNHHDGIINNIMMKDFFLNLYHSSVKSISGPRD